MIIAADGNFRFSSVTRAGQSKPRMSVTRTGLIGHGSGHFNGNT